MSVRAAVERVSLSPDADSSRVALFLLPEKPGFVDAVFDVTVETQRRVRAGDPLYVGSFSMVNSGAEVMQEIDAARYRQ